MAEIPFLTSSALAHVHGVRHGFFTREGGRSEGIYHSLNCGGRDTGDNPAHVDANCDLVTEALGAEKLVTVYQVHSADAVVVDRPFEGERPKADAMVTATPGLALGILTADCGPILFAANDGTVIGAAHAGWKGALTGIIESTVAAMETLGASRAHIHAVLGPCIGQASYQVGPEFRNSFIERDEAFGRFFLEDGTKYRFDIAAFILFRLGEAGIGAIDDLGCDTYADPKRFFSYRRTTHAKEPDYGRQISAIVIGSLG